MSCAALPPYPQLIPDAGISRASAWHPATLLAPRARRQEEACVSSARGPAVRAATSVGPDLLGTTPCPAVLESGDSRGASGPAVIMRLLVPGALPPISTSFSCGVISCYLGPLPGFSLPASLFSGEARPARPAQPRVRKGKLGLGIIRVHPAAETEECDLSEQKRRGLQRPAPRSSGTWLLVSHLLGPLPPPWGC